MRLERSQLSVPGSNWHMIEKSVTLDADVAFLDLEDAVVPAAKAEARQSVIRAFRALEWGQKPRAFRVNGLDTPYFYRDVIDVVEAAGNVIDFIILPKVNRPEDVYVLGTLLSQVESAMGLPGIIGIEAQIESAEGLLNAPGIAGASPRVKALIFGPGDFAASMGMPVSAIGAEDDWDAAYGADRWHHAMSSIVVAARAAGVRAIDGPLARVGDLDGLQRAARRARSLGFDGKWCIHPSQIAVVNEVFTPGAGEVAWARKVMLAYDHAMEAGEGAIIVDGVMVDMASVQLARRLLGSEG